MGAEVFLENLTDGQTDMKKLIVAFRNFANAPKDGFSKRMIFWLLFQDLPPPLPPFFLNLVCSEGRIGIDDKITCSGDTM